MANFVEKWYKYTIVNIGFNQQYIFKFSNKK